MSRSLLFAVVFGLGMAGLGYFAARVDIWWYHLGATQATLALWGAPLVLGAVGALYGFAISERADA